MVFAKGMLAGILLLLAAGLHAAPLRVGAMELAPGPAWQRVGAAREQADDAFELELPAAEGVALQLAVPRRIPVLKGDADSFYANLTRKWRAQHGRDAAIGWTEAGPRRWLTCRHPSGDRQAVVFQLATVFEGRAYTLVVFAPAGTPTLPRPAYELAAGAAFRQGGPRWIRTRTYRAQPVGEALEALAGNEAELGREGMLTGYGLDIGESDMSWFLEGFRWLGEGTAAKQEPMAIRGHLHVQAPDETEASADLALKFDLAVAPGTVAAEVRIHALCASPADLNEALARLGQGARLALERLERRQPAPCPDPGPAREPYLVQVEPGRSVEQVLSVALPASVTAAQLAGLRAAGLEPVTLVEIGVMPSPEGKRLGDALLERAGLFIRYDPGG